MARIYVQDPRIDKTNLFRQTDFFSGIFGKHYFSPFKDGCYDYALVYDSPDKTAMAVARERRIYFQFENAQIWRPCNEMLSQVGVVVSPFNLSVSPGTRWIEYHPAVPWFYGIPYRTDTGLIHSNMKSSLSLEKLSSKDKPDKTRLLSIVASSKVVTAGHHWRLQVLNEIKNYFGGSVDIFGFGHSPIASKEQAIDPYHFSIAIENMESRHYWTEKLSDVILGYAVPIYSGASRVNDYFSSMIPQIAYGISPRDYCKQVARIIDGSTSDKDLKNNREQILWEHNVFGVVAQIIEGRL